MSSDSCAGSCRITVTGRQLGAPVLILKLLCSFTPFVSFYTPLNFFSWTGEVIHGRLEQAPAPRCRTLSPPRPPPRPALPGQGMNRGHGTVGAAQGWQSRGSPAPWNKPHLPHVPPPPPPPTTNLHTAADALQAPVAGCRYKTTAGTIRQSFSAVGQMYSHPLCEL